MLYLRQTKREGDSMRVVDRLILDLEQNIKDMDKGTERDQAYNREVDYRNLLIRCNRVLRNPYKYGMEREGREKVLKELKEFAKRA